MNILFITEKYYPQISGVPIVVKYLADGLSAKGHEITLVTQRSNGAVEHEVVNGVDVFRFNIWQNWMHKPKGDISLYIDYIKLNKADVVILECSECITTDLLLPYLKDIRGRIIFHSHGLSGFDNKFFILKDNLKHTLGSTYNWLNSQIYFNWTFKKAFKHIDAFLCLSEVDSGIDYIKKNAKKYHILDNAADDMFFSVDIPANKIREYVKLANERYMVSCANYTVVKNQKEMIRQYFMSDSSQSYSLVCIGSKENKYYKECKDLILKLEKLYGYRDIHLLYGVLRNDIPSIIKGASLYLVASRWEQYSISIIEAMSQGIPFISTNVGNARLLPGGVTINSANEMYVEMNNLLTNEILYKEYANAGKLFAFENCRIDSVVDRLENIIKDII